jgi:hypothetical protein
MYVHLGHYPFKQEITLKYELFLDNPIKIRYRKILNDKQTSPDNNSAPPLKKKKVKERTIK